MSILLTVAILLLVLVVALSLWQRRSAASATPAPSPFPAQPTSNAVPRQPAVTGGPAMANTIHDPELGMFAYDELDGWTREDDLDFAGAAVLLTVASTTRPGEAHREWLRAALSDAASLDDRARAIVIPELRRRGVAHDDLVVYQMAFAEVEGATCGYLWYCVGDFAGEIGVSSRDRWRTLALEVVEG